MAENQPEQQEEEQEIEIQFTPWYFDKQNNPNCPSIWNDDYNCNKQNCPYSHELPLRLTHVPLNSNIEPNTIQMANWLKDYYMQELNKNSKAIETLQTEMLQESDMNTIDQLLEEMNNFEEVPDDTTIVDVCQAYKETGNCLFRGTCKHPHTLNYDEIQVQLKKQSWFPSSSECTCCKGYKFGCETCGNEECRNC